MFVRCSWVQQGLGWGFVALFILIRAAFSLKPLDHDGLVHLEQRTGRFILRLGLLIIVTFSVLSYALSGEGAAWVWLFLPLPSPVRWCGISLGYFTCILFFWTHGQLGMGWSCFVVVAGERVLLTSGPYRFARHPMLTILSLFTASIFLTSGYVPVTVALIFLWIYALSRIPQEEEILVTDFGVEYERYREKVGICCPIHLPAEVLMHFRRESQRRLSFAAEEADNYQDLST